ncbi:MAG: metal-dependent hydrolase [Candidatus Altiarchaeota archaeon]|nr:metal-dependent hydrolase [Candidatus Altiarchaeota archaeon]
MDSLSHFILAVLAGLALGLHRKHRIHLIVFISFCSVLIDLDHFLVPLGYASQYRSFHNVFVVFFLPFSLFLLSCFLERNGSSDRFQVFFLLLTVMLIGHVIADMIDGPVQIFYPVSDVGVSVPNVDIQATSDFISPIVNSHGLGLAIYAVVIFVGVFIHVVLFHMRRKRLSLGDALRHVVRDWF